MYQAPESIFSTALKQAGILLNLKGISPLVPEASTRRYYRLTFADGSTLVGVHEAAATARTNMPLVMEIQSFLKKGGVAVPEIVYVDAEGGLMLQHDLGDLSLHAALREQSDQADALYRQAIEHMLSWQRLSDDGHCPAFGLSFDVEKLMFEFDFFITHTLTGHYRAKLADSEHEEIRGVFLKIARELAAPQHKFFTHRDYHSRNIMVYNGQQHIIDFQDARLGLFQYDLVSLLYDAYAPLEKTLRSQLIDFAFETGSEIHRQARADFDRLLRLSAFQRVVKAMGTFGRQAALGRKDFEACLEPAWQMLIEITAGDVNLRGITYQLETLIEKHHDATAQN